MNELDRLVPLREAAGFLGVSKRTLERWIADERVPAPVKVGRKRVYPASVVAAMIEQAKGGQLCLP